MRVPKFVRSMGVLAAVAAAACAGDSTMVESLMVVPGYFDTLECPELVSQFQAASHRVYELTMLRAKAADEPSGALANAMAYNTEYARARATQKYSEDAANRKGCDLAKKTTAGPKPPQGRFDWAKPAH